MSQGQKVELCHWVVAFVDLLGQGDKMRDVSRLIDSGKEEDAVEGMKQIYFDHKKFYEAFHGTLISNQQSTVTPTIPLPANISKEGAGVGPIISSFCSRLCLGATFAARWFRLSVCLLCA